MRLDLRGLVSDFRLELAACIGSGDAGLAVNIRHAALLDLLLRRHAELVLPSRLISLAATGSYGRAALAFRSDADVRLIVDPSVSSEDAARMTDALLYPLWDSGLTIGHQVMTPEHFVDVGRTDLATATSLLDLRAIAGDDSLVTAVLDAAWRGLFDESGLADFLLRLVDEARTRHARFGGSVFLLEPDVKFGAGGLRDLDGARWAARARFRTTERASCERSQTTWGALVRVGVLVPAEAAQICAAEEFLSTVRNRLHAHADRRSDRLTFDEQEAIAIEMGYGVSSSGGELSADARGAAAERFMQDYYLHARAISRAREQIIELAMPPKRRGKQPEIDLGGGVRIFDGQITIAGGDALTRDPALAFRAYRASVQKHLPILPFARSTIAQAAADDAWSARLRESVEGRDLFVELVCTVAEAPSSRGSVLTELHEAGLLLAMVPEFRPVTGRVHHDVYHVYTVDVHSVAAVDRLRALVRGELAQEYPLASRVAAEVVDRTALFVATLLHDVGKGYPDASGSRVHHSVSGAELCDIILPRLGLSQEDVAAGRALVLEHLLMYHVATRRDLDDPAAISAFCERVRGREGLRDLYLLTVADISTTSPTAMTPWKAQMLDELFMRADEQLSATGGSRVEPRVSRLRDEARAQWHGDTAALDAFLDGMPSRYSIGATADAIVMHAQLAASRGKRSAIASATPSRHEGVVELCVVAADRPGVLARISAAISMSKFEVLAAQIYSRKLPPRDDASMTEAVDIFLVRPLSEGSSDGNASQRLCRNVEAMCDSADDPVDLNAQTTASQWRERPSPAVRREVVIDNRASTRHTVIEVIAKNRPGLLFALANALHKLGLSIAFSKINTEGAKVADVFYVSEVGGGKVEAPERLTEVRAALLAATLS